jgi:hypothetical protein
MQSSMKSNIATRIPRVKVRSIDSFLLSGISIFRSYTRSQIKYYCYHYENNYIFTET